jgi:hypothetical protein
MGLGVDDPLVDSESFPRADVDVHAARIARSELKGLSGTNCILTIQC